MQIVYIPSESMSVQGKKDEIYKRYGKDWNIREMPMPLCYEHST